MAAKLVLLALAVCLVSAYGALVEIDPRSIYFSQISVSTRAHLPVDRFMPLIELLTEEATKLGMKPPKQAGQDMFMAELNLFLAELPETKSTKIDLLKEYCQIEVIDWGVDAQPTRYTSFDNRRLFIAKAWAPRGLDKLPVTVIDANAFMPADLQSRFKGEVCEMTSDAGTTADFECLSYLPVLYRHALEMRCYSSGLPAFGRAQLPRVDHDFDRPFDFVNCQKRGKGQRLATQVPTDIHLTAFQTNHMFSFVGENDLRLAVYRNLSLKQEVTRYACAVAAPTVVVV